jgi:hypothetical protein
MKENDSTMQYQARVDKGRAREGRIMEEMRKQGLDIIPASTSDDILRGIDGYLTLVGHSWSTQIKVRQSAEDLLFVITECGKPGRDMKTQADLYAFLIQDQLYLIKTLEVRKAISDLVELMNRQHQRREGKFRVTYKGVDCELSTQGDPVSGNSKLMAFIPATLFTDVIDPIHTPCRITI